MLSFSTLLFFYLFVCLLFSCTYLQVSQAVHIIVISIFISIHFFSLTHCARLFGERRCVSWGHRFSRWGTSCCGALVPQIASVGLASFTWSLPDHAEWIHSCGMWCRLFSSFSGVMFAVFWWVSGTCELLQILRREKLNFWMIVCVLSYQFLVFFFKTLLADMLHTKLSEQSINITVFGLWPVD